MKIVQNPLITLSTISFFQVLKIGATGASAVLENSDWESESSQIAVKTSGRLKSSDSSFSDSICSSKHLNPCLERQIIRLIVFGRGPFVWNPGAAKAIAMRRSHIQDTVLNQLGAEGSYKRALSHQVGEELSVVTSESPFFTRYLQRSGQGIVCRYRWDHPE